MSAQKYLIAIIALTLVVGGFVLIDVKSEQDAKISAIMDNIVSLRDEMIAGDQGANIESLRFYVGALEEKLTGERKVLETALAEEQKQRQLALAQGQLSKLQADLEITKLQSSFIKLSEREIDLAKIVGEWEPRIVRVECSFGVTKQFGSGLLYQRSLENGDVVSVITNKHVVLDIFGRAPKSCASLMPDGSRFTSNTNSNEVDISATGLDFAILTINNSNTKLTGITSVSLNVCESKASTGAPILILGYPSIGSASSVTATDGIISGYDDNYYITNAKVERGNSGGAAIDLKNDCYLGIPSFVATGGLESLARILDVSVIGIK